MIAKPKQDYSDYYDPNCSPTLKPFRFTSTQAERVREAEQKFSYLDKEHINKLKGFQFRTRDPRKELGEPHIHIKPRNDVERISDSLFQTRIISSDSPFTSQFTPIK